jgi:hypothetical protein
LLGSGVVDDVPPTRMVCGNQDESKARPIDRGCYTVLRYAQSRNHRRERKPVSIRRYTARVRAISPGAPTVRFKFALVAYTLEEATKRALMTLEERFDDVNEYILDEVVDNTYHAVYPATMENMK